MGEIYLGCGDYSSSGAAAAAAAATGSNLSAKPTSSANMLPTTTVKSVAFSVDTVNHNHNQINSGNGGGGGGGGNHNGCGTSSSSCHYKDDDDDEDDSTTDIDSSNTGGKSQQNAQELLFPALHATVFGCLDQKTIPRLWCLRIVANPYPFVCDCLLHFLREVL